MLAAIAGIGLGVVLGPEAPLLALGGGLGILTVDMARKGAPDQVKLIMAAAGSFAAISTIFGNPVIGAVIIIEAAGLGGPMLPLVLLPGLLAAGIGSIVFLGMGTITGLSTSAYALDLLELPARPGPDDRRIRGRHRDRGARRGHRPRHHRAGLDLGGDGHAPAVRPHPGGRAGGRRAGHRVRAADGSVDRR